MHALPGIPSLKGHRTRLRSSRPADADALFALYSDPRVAAHGARAPMRDPAEGVGMVSEMGAFFAARERVPWVVTSVRGDDVIGTCTLFALDARHRQVEVGYALHPAHWGRGLACDAVATAIAWSRRALGVLEVVAEVAPANVRSQALLARLGFLRVGDGQPIKGCDGNLHRYRAHPDPTPVVG